jgi:hypothetical protein
MQSQTGTPQSVPTPGASTSAACSVPAAQPRGCPACAAPMVPLRGQYRCTRCYFTFCVGCEDGGQGEG